MSVILALMVKSRSRAKVRSPRLVEMALISPSGIINLTVVAMISMLTVCGRMIIRLMDCDICDN